MAIHANPLILIQGARRELARHMDSGLTPEIGEPGIGPVWRGDLVDTTADATNELAPFFIIGCPRSGTTLLQALLNRHPEIAVPPETKIFCDFDGQPHSVRQRCLERIARDLGVSLTNDASRATIHAGQLLREVQRLFVQQLGRTKVRLVGEKTPEHTSRLNSIREAFPEVPIIAMVRNGFDVAQSLANVPWIKCTPGVAAMIWSHYMRYITNAIDQGLPRICVVRYEELTSNPEDTLREVFDFLEVESGHELQCMKPNKTLDRYLFPEREIMWKGRATTSVSTERSARSPLDSYSRRAIQVGCQELLERWGYNEDLQAIGRLATARLKVLNWCACFWTTLHLPRSRVISEMRVHWRCR